MPSIPRLETLNIFNVFYLHPIHFLRSQQYSMFEYSKFKFSCLLYSSVFTRFKLKQNRSQSWNDFKINYALSRSPCFSHSDQIILMAIISDSIKLRLVPRRRHSRMITPLIFVLIKDFVIIWSHCAHSWWNRFYKSLFTGMVVLIPRF